MELEESVPSRENHHNQIQSSENETIKNDDKILQFKIIASQVAVSFPVVLTKFRTGMAMGFTTVLVPEIFKKNSEIDVTLDELTWFSSYCFVTPIAAIFGGFLAQLMGARRLLMCSNLFFILADLIFHWANNIALILIAQVIVGFTNGIFKGAGYSYIAEVTHPKFRSITMSIMSLSILFGIFLSTLLGSVINWRTQTLVSMIFPVIGFALIHFIPDSPYWLASKNRLHDAENSLKRLRWWATPEAVKAELNSIKNASISLPLSEITEGKDLNSKKKAQLKKVLSLYLHRSFYIPLLIIICIFFFGTCNSEFSFSPFSVLIFQEIKSPIDGHVVSAILSASLFAGALVYIFTVRFLGKRFLALATIFVTIICLTLSVIFIYLMDENQSTFRTYSWVVSIALIISAFAQQSGMGTIMHFLNSELFPQKLRYIGSGIGYFIFEIISAILNKIFLYIVNAITFSNTLILFAIINIVGFVVIYFILPETEGVSLQDIEAHYAGTRSLKNKVKN